MALLRYMKPVCCLRVSLTHMQLDWFVTQAHFRAFNFRRCALAKKIKLDENLTDENFYRRKFPDLLYIFSSTFLLLQMADLHKCICCLLVAMTNNIIYRIGKRHYQCYKPHVLCAMGS